MIIQTKGTKMKANLNETVKNQLDCLKLKHLAEHWDNFFRKAEMQKPSYNKFLTTILQKEYDCKKENTRLTRIKNARVPETFIMETFPFSKQRRLNKKLVMGLYDSLRFINEKQELIFIGPTGCGKTGLATSFLMHALNNECKGLFIDFNELTAKLFQACADHSEQKLLKKYQSYDILLIDELGNKPLESEQAGLFFDLIKKRNKKKTTILTSQLGFDEWINFLCNKHTNAGLLDRITQNCTIFNMKDCISIRPKNIVYATDNSTPPTEHI